MHILDWVVLVVVFVLQEGVVALSVASGHLDFADSCSIRHVADHA